MGNGEGIWEEGQIGRDRKRERKWKEEKCEGKDRWRRKRKKKEIMT